MRATAAVSLLSALAVGGVLFATPASASPATAFRTTSTAFAASTSRPHSFTAVTARPGPGPGEVTFSWSHDGLSTTSYVLETALSVFSKTSTTLPRTGRNDRVWSISPSARSFTMGAAQLATAGAPAGSANHLYFRLFARNANGVGTSAERAYPYLQAVMPHLVPNAPGGTPLRIASFNVRTSKVTTDVRSWMERRTEVAAEIVDYAPAVVALQELGPGRADGLSGSTTGTMRQTDSLLDSLASQGASRYKLVRSTPYVEPGLPANTQGMRLLYDSSRVAQVSVCSQMTGTHNYSSSCSFTLPLLSGDAETVRRRAAYAQFRDLSSGKQFYVVSTHLDTRHSTTTSTEKVYNQLRADQAEKILSTMATVNTEHLPLVVAGDMNSWQTIVVGNGPHDTLVDAGFTDTAAAATTVKIDYATFNDFDLTQYQYAQGFGVRLDQIMVQGFSGATRFENVTEVTDSARPSDHNMVVADTLL